MIAAALFFFLAAGDLPPSTYSDVPADTPDLARTLSAQVYEALGLQKLTPDERRAVSYLVQQAALSAAQAAKAACGRQTGDWHDATVLAYDGRYLGKLTNRFDTESIANQFGTPGNKFNTDSVMSEFGAYGSKTSDMSPWNKNATRPPVLYRDGAIVGVFTANLRLPNALNSFEILANLK